MIAYGIDLGSCEAKGAGSVGEIAITESQVVQDSSPEQRLDAVWAEALVRNTDV